NYEKARVEFKNVLQIDPKDAPARYALGQTMEKLGDLRGAIGNYNAAVDIDPEFIDALIKVGEILLQARQADAAQEKIDTILALEPDNPAGLALQAGASALNGDEDTAMELAQRSLSLAPGNIRASSLLAALHVKQKNSAAALEVLEAAIAVDPDSVELLNVKARVQIQQADRAGAQATLEQIIAKQPTELRHRELLARYLVSQDPAGAEAVLRKAVADLPEENRAKLLLIEYIANTSQDKDAALALVDQYIAQDEENYELYFAKGKIFEATRDWLGAEVTYDAIIERDELGPSGLTARTRKAISLLRQGDKDASRVQIEEVLAENPRDKEALKLRGSLALDEGDASAAIADFRSALRDNPDDIALIRLLARAHAINGEKELALDVLRQGVDRSPRSRELRVDLAQYYSGEGDVEAAGQQLMALSELAPGDIPTLKALYKLRTFQKDYDGALQVAEQIKSTNPDNPEGFYLAGLVHQANRDLLESIREFESALALEPNGVQPLSQLIKSHLALDQQDIARRRLEEAIELNPENYVAYNLLGEIQLAGKAWTDAEASFGRGIEINPKWAILYRNKALALGAQKKEDEAVATIAGGIEATEGAPLLVTAYASYLERVGKLDEAIGQYESMLERDPTSQLAANNLAMLLVEYKDDPEALSRARDLAAPLKTSDNAAYLDTVGWIEYKVGEIEQAVSFLKRAVDAAPDSAVLRYHLG
ncbi:MAG: tetratricopeptide repeat protein, partial [Gammaproteobacteria bacterium]|nr:tetratricopeptide repeat protein [Gammaproteobacteria bacterium]